MVRLKAGIEGRGCGWILGRRPRPFQSGEPPAAIVAVGCSQGSYEASVGLLRVGAKLIRALALCTRPPARIRMTPSGGAGARFP